MHISSTNDGTIYTTDISQGPGSERIAVSRTVNGQYRTLERLGPPVNGDAQTMHPYIAPDESYMIFTSRKPSEKISFVLLISFKQPDGNWSQPQTIDLGVQAGLPFVSHDGRFLFFTGGEPGKSDIFWVSSAIIVGMTPSGKN